MVKFVFLHNYCFGTFWLVRGKYSFGGFFFFFLPRSSGWRLANGLLIASCFEGTPKKLEAGDRGSESARCRDLLQGELRPPQEDEEVLQA